jgi:hypothetical protein
MEIEINENAQVLMHEVCSLVPNREAKKILTNQQARDVATRIDIGDGETASFWHDNRCTHGPLASWAPDLFSIATRKKRSVAKEISDNNWIRSVARLTPLHS